MKGTVLTYIFGDNYEVLRDPIVTDPNVNYVCITNNTKLKSNIWHMVYDEVAVGNNNRAKMVYTKYNPFKYTNTDKICVIDSSMQLDKPLDSFWDILNQSDILVNKHPERTNLVDEINAWKIYRGLSDELASKFITMASVDRVNLHTDFLIGSCILGFKNNEPTRNLCQLVIKYMRFLGSNNSLFPSNQCVLSYLIQKLHYNYQWIFEENYATRYTHNTWLSKTIHRIW